MKPISRWPFVVLLALTTCASPNPALYTIQPVPGAVQPNAPRIIVLRQVGVARYLNRSQIVRSGSDYRLVVASNDWWGEPLAGMITRVLFEELSQRLPNATVTSELSVVGASPDATVEVEIRRLDGTGANAVALSAQVEVGFKNGPPIARTVNMTIPQTQPDTRGFAAAASIAIGRVADLIVGIVSAH
ncbi:MAG TPA: PqiC family protein [Acetobacteraceae bacterium]|nr:PqiC family protein [Acetobacteraceae bacterium]